jgi:DNA-binding HxlR family transcriptional regulator
LQNASYWKDSAVKQSRRSARRSDCPGACALDLVGDKWTLLVVRDLLRGRTTYGELADSAEGIPTNILADRLRRLEEYGLVKAVPYQQRPVRYAYTLTEKGLGLGDVLASLARWGKRHFRGTVVMPEFSSSSRSSLPGRR